MSEDIAILHSLEPLKHTSADLLHTPHYVELGRIVLVTSGKATHQINLVPYETQAGDVLVIPQHNYISITSLSDDYEGQMLSFGRLPIDFEKCARLCLKEDDFRRMLHYVDLLWEIVHRPYDRQTVEHLETALLYDLKLLHAHQSSDNSAQPPVRRYPRTERPQCHGLAQRPLHSTGTGSAAPHQSVYLRDCRLSWLSERHVLHPLFPPRNRCHS